MHLPATAASQIFGVVSMKVVGGIPSAIKDRLYHRINEEVIILHDFNEHAMRSDTSSVIGYGASRRRSFSAPNATFVHLAEQLGITCWSSGNIPQLSQNER